MTDVAVKFYVRVRTRHAALALAIRPIFLLLA